MSDSTTTGSLGESVAWANAPAGDAPSIQGELPGPRSRELFEKTEKFQYGSYFQLVNMLPIAFTEGRGEAEIVDHRHAQRRPRAQES